MASSTEGRVVRHADNTAARLARLSTESLRAAVEWHDTYCAEHPEQKVAAQVRDLMAHELERREANDA